VDKSKIQSEITTLQAQLISNAGAASFSGENWLSVDSSAVGYSATKSIVASFTRSAAGTVSVTTIDINTATTKLFDAAAAASGILDTDFTTTGAGAVTVSVSTLSITAASVDNDDLDDMITNVDTALKSMTTAASDLGAAKKRVGLQQDFVSSLMDAIERGVGQLVDADMNEESTRLQALQVQQQLGIQALSIANQNSQSILSLFR
jgi:flagellin